ncbi:MAG: hypothetical protein Q7T77_07080 [Sulfuricurvum sp.]|nr:hypothetical protein [Sulfuricurvum sp.]
MKITKTERTIITKTVFLTLKEALKLNEYVEGALESGYSDGDMSYGFMRTYRSNYSNKILLKKYEKEIEGENIIKILLTSALDCYLEHLDIGRTVDNMEVRLEQLGGRNVRELKKGRNLLKKLDEVNADVYKVA